MYGRSLEDLRVHNRQLEMELELLRHKRLMEERHALLMETRHIRPRSPPPPQQPHLSERRTEDKRVVEFDYGERDKRPRKKRRKNKGHCSRHIGFDWDEYDRRRRDDDERRSSSPARKL